MLRRALEQLEEFAIDVILERRYGKRAALLRLVLWLLSFVYTKLMRVRCFLYEHRFLRWHSVGCLVISVGNLTVGGTGKTPIVEKFARTLTKAGRRVAILSRGYKSVPRPFLERMFRKFTFQDIYDPPRIVTDGTSLLLDSERAGDEPYMLASNLEDVIVLVDKDRVKSALYAVKEMDVDTIILDDGYQYLPLKERINLLLVDRQSPFGNEYLLPRGTMREPRDHLKRGDTIFITKCDGSDISDLKAELRSHNQHAEMLECAHHPLFLQNIFTGERKELSYLKERNVGALSGIARPESFEDGLRELGANLIYARHFEDHHRFSAQEVLNSLNRTRARGGHALITTEKDAVRFPKVDVRDVPIYFLRVEIRLMDDDETFEQCVLRICGVKPAEAGKRELSASR